MTEAHKLTPLPSESTEPDAKVASGPSVEDAVPREVLIETVVSMGPPDSIGFTTLPPNSHELESEEAHLVTSGHSRPVELLERATHVFLKLFLIGFVAFIAGIALASAVLLGQVDLDTGWVHNLLETLKELASRSSN